MKELTSSEIRNMFLEFFQSKNHTVEPSAPLIPVDDPTLLWINSGVATLKKYFDGSVVPKNPRITNAQKCIRTNDIENVGKTARHHTFFEMLGNFSVGDYFKEDAIPWAWEFLTSPKWLKMDPERLYITVYPKDTESYRIWHEKVDVPADHILKNDDNFWDIGEGPSGPDSEIFYDRGQEFNDLDENDPENYPGGENERYLEVWNIVFSELNHLPNGEYVEQPHKNIDTGMGLERLVSISQNAKTNFETDLFLPLIRATEEMSNNKKYGDNDVDDTAFKIIADHIRSVSFAIADGALPSNEGRGYVIRRLIRRAVLNGRKLGIEESFLYKLVPVVGDIMGDFYQEIIDQQELIQKVIKAEEKRFSATLTDGLALFNKLIDELKSSGKKEISGKDAFKLFDTYGFPYELTAEGAEDEGISVDKAGFDAEMQKQKDRARAARGNSQSMGSQDEVLMDIDVESEFVGYHDNYEVSGAVLKVIIENDSLVDNVDTGKVGLIFDKTPFYAEMGGQVADHGDIKDADGNIIAVVEDVQHAPNGQNIHYVSVLDKLSVNETFNLQIDVKRRMKVRKNHTATHLLDQALREVIGDQTHQSGSLVEPEYLRFDFASMDPLSTEQIDQVEKIVNEKIWEEIPVTTVETDMDTAQKMGAIALFTDKYGDKVRVVSIGDYSVQLCGGTHAENTSELGIFKILSESSVGSGTRRIEAVTSKEAYDYLTQQAELLNKTANLAKVSKVDQLPQKVAQLNEDLKIEKRNLQNFKAKAAGDQAGELFQNTEQMGDYSVIAQKVDVEDMNGLRRLADDWKNKEASDILVLGSDNDGRANLIVAVNKKANDNGIKAGDLIKELAQYIGGGGGGRPDMAQAGGKNPAGFDKLFAELRKKLA